MQRYNKNELIKRDKIIKTQKQFIEFLNSDIINNLIYLFDISNNSNDSITNYVYKERKIRGLDDSNIKIISEVYGEQVKNSTLFLKIQKNSKDFIHLTIHLVPKTLKPERDGIIHICKDSYIEYNKSNKKYAYALISVENPEDKPNSLVFSIADGYTTPKIKNSELYDPEIQKEMDVIIAVLNKLFDEDHPLYIGNKFYFIHNKTNIVLNNINKHTTLVKRKNRGIKMLPSFTNNAPIKIHRKRNQKTRKLKHN
jgi:hypothetical protein